MWICILVYSKQNVELHVRTSLRTNNQRIYQNEILLDKPAELGDTSNRMFQAKLVSAVQEVCKNGRSYLRGGDLGYSLQ